MVRPQTSQSLVLGCCRLTGPYTLGTFFEACKSYCFSDLEEETMERNMPSVKGQIRCAITPQLPELRFDLST